MQLPNVSHFVSHLFLLKYSWVTVLCQFLVNSIVTQPYINVCVYTYISSFCHTIFCHVLSQEIGYSSLCCTIGYHIIYSYCFCFLGLCLWHMEVPRLGVTLELQLLASTTVTATPDLSCVCSLHNSSWQCWILNTVSKARDRNWLSHNGKSL